MRYKSKTCAFLLAGVLLTGCSLRPEPVELAGEDQPRRADYSALTAVLNKCVDHDGDVLPKALGDIQATLDQQLRLLAVTGPSASPELFPSDADRQAYWLNAHAAWSLKLFLLQGSPAELNLHALHGQPFSLDGRRMTLSDVEAQLRRLADFRLAVLAPCVCLQHGRLPTQAIAPRDVAAFLDEGFNAYVLDGRRFVVDVERHELRVSPTLYQAMPSLVQSHEQKMHVRHVTLQTALLPYAQGRSHRRLQDAMGYSVVRAQPTPLSVLVDELKSLR